jgi:hypothetical protein
VILQMDISLDGFVAVPGGDRLMPMMESEWGRRTRNLHGERRPAPSSHQIGTRLSVLDDSPSLGTRLTDVAVATEEALGARLRMKEGGPTCGTSC